jgi:tetratricopeptide (TPR) repeat protein/tRNA A-37 threonylcarbamoyl transferase component Bud32
MAEQPRQQAEFQPGDRIGKYEVREVLGVGGQSVVYKCYDAALDRAVAVKQIISPLVNDETFRQQLTRRIATVARLGSRNEAIVTIHELIENERGLFTVMEFVEGHTLETLIREADGPIETKATLLILFRLAAALHEMHAAGMIHRDIKPANIIITDGLRPKIIDFGVAAVGEGDASLPLATTKYLAPELYGDGPVDARADIYSLGFVMYEMLAGREAFNEVFAEVVRDRHSEALRWMKWHGNEGVEAPPLSQVNPAVPAQLSAIIARMIAKSPEDRFANTEELGRAIKQHFSPGAKRQAAARPAAGRRQPSQHRAGAGMISQLAQQRGLGSLEGDEVEIDDPMTDQLASGQASLPALDGPATAPLPKEPMTRRKKITLAALAAVVLLGTIGAGIAWMVKQDQARQRRAASAEGVYASARQAFKNGQYAPALEGFTQLVETHPDTSQGLRAAVLAPMARAHLAIEAGDFDKAQLEENRAAEQAESLLAGTDREDLAEWVRARQDDIEQLQQYRYSAAIYDEAIATARQQMSTATSEADFQDVLDALERKIGAPDVQLTSEQVQAVQNLRQDIRWQRFLYVYQQQIDQAEQLLTARSYAQAEAAFTKALDLLKSDDPALKQIPRSQQEQMQKDVIEKIATLRKQRDQDKTYAAIQRARQGEDPVALEQALRDALKLPELSAEQRTAYEAGLKEIEAGKGMALSRGYDQKGNTDAAVAALQRVLVLVPDHAEAQAMLDRIQREKKRQELIAQGERAYLDKEYGKALELYRQAGRLGMNDELARRISESEYQLLVETAQTRAQAGQYDQARAAYQRARMILPANAPQIDAMLKQLTSQQQFGSFLAQGNQALQAGKYDQALQWYDKAKDIRETPEVLKAIQLANYKSYLDQGDRARNNDDIKTARWYYNMARKQRDTAEIRQRIASVSESSGE